MSSSEQMAERYRWAGQVARVAMGKTQAVRGAPAQHKADADPLAWWCLTELIATGGPSMTGVVTNDGIISS